MIIFMYLYAPSEINTILVSTGYQIRIPKRYFLLNSINLFLPVLEVEKSEIRLAADSVCGEDCLPGLQLASFSLMCSHDLSLVHRTLVSSSYKSTNPITKIPPARSHINLITFQRPHFTYHHIGNQCFNIQILEGHKSVSSQQCIIILNVYVPNNRASKYMKKKNNALKGEQADL